MLTNGRILLAVPLCLALVAGCGSNKSAPAKITGHVKYKGEPVTGGTITFYAEKGGGYPAEIDPDGTYSVADVPLGAMKVAIETESVKNLERKAVYRDNKGHVQQNSPLQQEGGSAGPPPKYVKIPAKYKDPQTSNLTCDVTYGKQKKDFELTD
jgi:hypothetical protein